MLNPTNGGLGAPLVSASAGRRRSATLHGALGHCVSAGRRAELGLGLEPLLASPIRAIT